MEGSGTVGVSLSVPYRHRGLLGYVRCGSGRVVLWETQDSILLEKVACCRPRPFPRSLDYTGVSPWDTSQDLIL